MPSISLHPDAQARLSMLDQAVHADNAANPRPTNTRSAASTGIASNAPVNTSQRAAS